MNSLHIHLVISDPHLIAWVERQANRSEAIRQAIWHEIAPAQPVTRDEVRALLREELARVAAAGGPVAPVTRQDVDVNAGELLDKMF